MLNNSSYLPILPHPFSSPSPSISHTLSCNSILMGFIGLAIHLSAAAQFNYISEPSGLSPDNLQHSPPSHQHTLLPALSRIHTHKIQFLCNNGGTEMKQPTEATSFTHSSDFCSECVCVYVCVMPMKLSEQACCMNH